MNAEFGLSPWVLAGLVTGAVFALVVVAVFVAGRRLFPTPQSGEGTPGGDQRRRTEIREYLAGIGERFVEDETVAGHSVAFYLPDREVAVTFDARSYLEIREADVDAVLCEHEMPGAALGARLPFETPEVGVGPGDRTGASSRWGSERRTESDPERPDPVAVRESFAVLGLETGADAEAVRSAYRERVQEVHPDHGGDAESFRRLREAYETALEHAEGEATPRAR